MAEERNLATARAPENAGDDDVTKAELQRRMEEARESITQTVTEIKDTVTNQYQAVKETVTEALDWREQFRKRPVAFSIGALSVGFIVGYSIGGVIKGDGYDYDYEQELDLGPGDTPSYYSQTPEGGGARAQGQRSYAAQAITGSAYGAADDKRASSRSSFSPPASKRAEKSADYQMQYGASQTAQDAAAGTAEDEDKGPGLIERFKGTKAYDRLEEEVSALGDRFLDELSKTAQSVVLPALFSKVKELFGVDLSNKQSTSSSGAGSSSGSGGSQQRTPWGASETRTSGAASSSAAGAGSSSGGGASANRAGDTTLSGRESGGGSGASSYGTSENRGYGATNAAGGEQGRGGGGSGS